MNAVILCYMFCGTECRNKAKHEKLKYEILTFIPPWLKCTYEMIINRKKGERVLEREREKRRNMKRTKERKEIIIDFS